MNSIYDYYNYMNNLDNYNNMNDMNNLNNIIGLNNVMNNYNNNVSDPYTGFIRGNMFLDLYDPYKNYQPAQVSAKNERENLLLQIQELAFAMNDIALYLDINQNDINMVNLFNTYSKKKKELCKTYEAKFGPLDRDYYKYNDWRWDNNPWPWEVIK